MRVRRCWGRFGLAVCILMSGRGAEAASPRPPEPEAICRDCPGPEPEPVTCPPGGACYSYVFVRASGTCEISYKAAGTACNDNKACTYADRCNSTGTCVGTAITCAGSGPCELKTCNGTSTCSVSAAKQGTLCRAAAHACDAAEVCTGTSTSCPADRFAAVGTPCGADACGCNGSGACVLPHDQTAYCYDPNGNMTARVVVPAGQACLPASCP